MNKPQKKGLVPALRFPEFQNAGAWEDYQLGQCLSRHPEYGINAPAVPYTENLPTYIRITDISDDGQIRQDQRVSVAKGVTDENYLEYGDIVLARTGASVGKSYKYRTEDGRLVFAGFLIRVKPNEEKLNSELLFQFLSTERYWHWVNFISARSGQPGINGNEYASLPIQLPPTVKEQQKIADCLASIDDLITAETQKLAALKIHKKGLMQQLFPAEGETVPRLRFPEFRDAGDWESQKLEGLAKRGSGHTPNKAESSYYNGGIKWVSLADSNKLDNGYIYETKIQISNNGLKNSSAVLHPSGTVIVSRDAGVGKSAILHSEMAVSQHFIVWVCDQSKLLNWFLYYILQILKPTFEMIAVGSTIKTIGLPYFKDLCIFIPSVEEQQKIADCLSSVDALIEAQGERIDALKLHKKGLMQQLFPVMEEVEA
ncbi:MAG: hypothetical protein BWK73_16270 [Thiothrix lacustris]|uniref:Type I restriction modification DNA specificity domain-containing protein n=1 Tax=Thiothrix lacustris TaxID=525917 RepID=A0A1Y1QR75_9GAMM|nr:MAG: hypothetical protein BWK73_16270 [Thiothrix lacustris]